MKKSLPISKVKALIANAIEAFPHDECASCECFLGYVAQLEYESDQMGQEFLKNHNPGEKRLIRSLGVIPVHREITMLDIYGIIAGREHIKNWDGNTVPIFYNQPGDRRPGR